MSKWFEVEVTKTTTYMVEVEDHDTEDFAVEVVTESLFSDQWDDTSVERVTLEGQQLERLLASMDKNKVMRL